MSRNIFKIAFLSFVILIYSVFPQNTAIAGNFDLTHPPNLQKIDLDDCNSFRSSQNMSNISIYKNNITNLNYLKPIRVLVYYIEFVDLPISDNLKSVISKFEKNIDAYFAAISENKISFIWTESKLHNKLTFPVKEYSSQNIMLRDQTARLIMDAQRQAFTYYNKSDFDYFLTVPPIDTRTTDIPKTISILQRGSDFLNGTILAGDFWQGNKSWSIPAHEIGHAIGLADLYEYQEETLGNLKLENFHKQFSFMGFFDLMNWPTGPAPEMNAWNRWSLGLIRDNQITCLSSSSSLTLLDPIELKGGTKKAVFLKIDESRMIVVENRAAIGFDSRLPAWATGIIIYEVNTNIETGKGPLRIIPKDSKKPRRVFEEVLKPGDQATFEGFRIKYLFQKHGKAVIKAEKIAKKLEFNPNGTSKRKFAISLAL